MRLLKVELIPNGGNVKAKVQVETPNGGNVVCKIVKQDGARAYLDTPRGLAISHKQKRILQREAVTAWAGMINDMLEGMLESETVFTGKRFKRLGIQLKVFCPVCDRNTPSEFSKRGNGLNRNSCYFCGTLRKGKPFIGTEEMEAIQEKLKACESTGVADEQQRMD